MKATRAIPLLAVLAACAACSSSHAAPAASPSTTAGVTLSGTVVLEVTDFTDTTVGSSTAVAAMHVGDPCTGTGAYTTATAGLTVAVTGPGGKSLGAGALDAGTIANYPSNSNGIVSCELKFTTTVPAGAGTYTVTVGSFGSKTVTASGLGAVVLQL
jgi:hypothetical protein